jgi:Glycosyltransferase family 87
MAPFYGKPRPRIAIACGIILITIDLVAVTLRRMRQSGDFDISMEFGRRFVSGGHLYQGGLHFPYLPGAAMFYAPFALLPRPLAFLMLYSLAILGLWLVMRVLAMMVYGPDPVLRAWSWQAIVTLILGSHYIVRDLDDGGPNLILLALVTGTIYLASAEREVGAAVCLGAAAAFKPTTGIFIPFLVWKRRWRLAAYSALATAW